MAKIVENRCVQQALATGLSILFLVGCGNGFRPTTSSSVGSSCLNEAAGQSALLKSVIRSTSFSEQKLDYSGELIRPALKNGLMGQSLMVGNFNSSYLPSGEKMVALLDTQCVSQNGLSLDAQRLLSYPQIDFSNHMQTWKFNLAKNWDADEFEHILQADDCVIGVSQNRTVHINAAPNDTYFASRQDYLATIKASQAWDVFYNATTGIASNQKVKVAVVDTGVDYNHTELRDNMWANSQNQHGRDYVNNDTNPMDDHLHGTMVSGLIAAKDNNNAGIAGVAGHNVQIMAVKVADEEGSASISDLVDGIGYAVQNGADVINLSIGGTGSSSAVDAAIQAAIAANVTVVVAAGNNGREVTASRAFFPTNNGATSGVIAVASSAPNSTELSDFSNYGVNYVDIAAPGESLINYPTANPNGGVFGTVLQNAYGYHAGTSFSAPLVSGAAALAIAMMRTKGRSILTTPAVIESLITEGGRRVAGFNGKVRNQKLLDLKGLADLALNPPNNLIIRQPKNENAVLGENVTFTVQTYGSTNLTYQWYKNNQPINGATESEYTITSINNDDNAKYSVKVHSNTLNSDVTSDQATLKVYANYCAR